MKAYLDALRLFNRDVRLFLLAVAIQGFVFFGIYALLLNLYLLRLGYGPGFIGAVNAAGPIALALVSLPAGAYSRRVGSRRALMVGFAGSTIGFGLLPLGEFLPDMIEQVWILCSYGLSWAFGGMLIINFAPFMMAATSPRERDYVFSLQTGLLPLCGFAGNLVGGLLPGWFALLLGVSDANPAPYQLALLLAAILEIFAVISIAKTDVQVAPGTRQKPRDGGSSLPLTLIIVIAIVFMLRASSEWTMRIFFNVYLDSVLAMPTALIGTLLASGQLLGLAALTAPLVVARFGKVRTITWCLVGIGLAFVPLVLASHWLAVGIGFVVMIALVSISNPAYGVFSQELVLPQWRTTISSAMTLSLGIGIALIALGGGYIILHYSYTVLFAMGGLVALSSALIFRVYFRKSRGEPAQGTILMESTPVDVPPQ